MRLSPVPPSLAFHGGVGRTQEAPQVSPHSASPGTFYLEVRRDTQSWKRPRPPPRNRLCTEEPGPAGVPLAGGSAHRPARGRSRGAREETPALPGRGGARPLGQPLPPPENKRDIQPRQAAARATPQGSAGVGSGCTEISLKRAPALRAAHPRNPGRPPARAEPACACERGRGRSPHRAGCAGPGGAGVSLASAAPRAPLASAPAMRGAGTRPALCLLLAAVTAAQPSPDRR